MLEGLKVLDFSRLLPGPFCSLLLADMGADVIKIEDPKGGDYARYYPPILGNSGAFFESLNRNKRSVTLNLKHPQAREIVLRMVEESDVVLETFRPGVMDALGLGYTDLSAFNPQIIYCSISGYGHTGAFREKAGHDMNYLAHSGLLSQTMSGDSLALPGFQLADIAGGALYAATGILAALYKRSRSHTGSFLDISMTEGALSFAIPMLAIHAAGGNTNPAQGMLNGGIAAYNIYRTKDGKHLAVAALEPKFWMGFVDALKRPDLIDKGHLEGSQEQIATIASIIADHDLEHWVRVFESSDVCVEPVLNLDETLESTLHKSRNAFFELHGVQHVRTPLTPHSKSHTAAPTLGEHTDSVLATFEFDPEELRKNGVV